MPCRFNVTSVDEIALRERCSLRHVNMTISLAFLAPKLVRAAVEGRLPRGVNLARLRDAPAEWSRGISSHVRLSSPGKFSLSNEPGDGDVLNVPSRC